MATETSIKAGEEGVTFPALLLHTDSVSATQPAPCPGKAKSKKRIRVKRAVNTISEIEVADR